MGKADDSAGVVALVPFSAEKGKGLCRAGPGKGVCRCADLTAVSSLYIECLFPFLFGVLGIILDAGKLPRISELIKKYAHFSPSGFS